MTRGLSMSEIELKLLLDADHAAGVLQRISRLGIADGEQHCRMLRSIYYDTEAGALRAAGISLRLRHDGTQWLQTVKQRGRIAGGLSQAEEIEQPAPDGRLRLAAIASKPMRQRVRALVGDAPLHPVVETDIRRTSCDIVLDDGTRANIAVDAGEIKAAELSRVLNELEIELVRGDPKSLYTIARAILPEGGLRFSSLSKAARGFLLAEEGHIEPPAKPRKAGKVALERRNTVQQAARASLRECLDQVTANIQAVRALDTAGGPHQLRIGLRRLRTALSIFKPIMDCPERANLVEDCRWLAHQVGRLRDLDVVSGTIVAPLAAAHGEERGFQSLTLALDEQSAQVRDALRQLLVGRRTQSMLINLAEFIEAGDWAAAGAPAKDERSAMSVMKYARRALDRRWRNTARHAEGIASFDLHQRHTLRKKLKALRYTVEFFSPLLPNKRMRPFSRRLKTLQAVFGDLNDAGMAETALTAAPFDALADPATQRAIGRVIGSCQMKAEHSWGHAQALWDDLAACELPWR